MSGFRNSAATDTDNLFDADTVGDGPTPSGYPLRYAAIKYGSKGPDIGYRDANGTDLSNYWAAKGTAVYALNVNGRSFSSNNGQRGTGSVNFNIYANGTFDVQDWRSTTNITVLASGTWLPAGDSAANWTIQFDYGLSGSSTIGSGSNGVECTAPGVQKPCTGDNHTRIYSTAITVGTRAQTGGTIVATLFRGGVQRSQTTIHTSTSADGN